MENEWEREKQKILNSLRGLGQDTIDFQPESEVNIDLFTNQRVNIEHFAMLGSGYHRFPTRVGG